MILNDILGLPKRAPRLLSGLLKTVLDRADAGSHEPITREEFAKRSGLSEGAIRELYKFGAIKKHKQGRQIFISTDQLPLAYVALWLERIGVPVQTLPKIIIEGEMGWNDVFTWRATGVMIRIDASDYWRSRMTEKLKRQPPPVVDVDSLAGPVAGDADD